MKQTLNKIPLSVFIVAFFASIALMSYGFACNTTPKCGDGEINQSWEECDGEDGCTSSCAYEMKKVPVETCTGEGKFFVYQYDQTQPVKTDITATGDQVLVFARNDADITVKVNGLSKSFSLVASESFAKILSVSTNPGDVVTFESPSGQEARKVQAYLSQDSANPVYDPSTLEVVIDEARENDMSLPAGIYNYAFFDKYSFYDSGAPDSRKLSTIIKSDTSTVVDKTYYKPYPLPTEGVVIDSYTIPSSDIYTLSVDTDDSMYWMYTECPAICGDGVVNQPSEQCDGTDGVGEHQICEEDCTITNLPYCGDGVVNQPSEECDGDDGVGEYETCEEDCTITELPYCGNGVINEGEDCDDGNDNDQDSCSNSCEENYCEFELLKTDIPDPVSPGAFLDYQVKLTNTGTAYCTGGGVKLKEYYDSMTSYVSANPSPISGNNLWNFGEVPPGEVNTVDIKTKVSDDAVCDSTLVNKVCVWAAELTDWQCATETTTVECPKICGDGVVNQPSEQCDGTDGVGPNQECTSECKIIELPYCGDGTVNQPSEQCDGTDGVGEHQVCEEDCTITELPYCGNGILDAGEECDGTAGVGENEICEDNCTITELPYCGNGILDAGEECDGQAGIGQYETCEEDCTITELPYCGNGILDAGEECDGTAGVGENEVCEEDCTITELPYCGNGILDAGEECDGQAGVGQYETCEEDCTITELPYCGNGILDEGEQCDGSAGVGENEVCEEDCTIKELPYCGNGILDAGEECDGQAGVGPNEECSSSCELIDLPYCGDGKLDSGEECDDGNNKSGDGCSAICKEEKEDEDDCDGSIGNTIWLDSNANGIQDEGEKGIEDVRVKLTWFGPDDDDEDEDDNEVYREETNSKGRYEFDDLCEGKYRVRVKDEDVEKYVQVYDPDDKEDNKTNVRLKGDNDHHTKADFGYKGARVAPATGTGSVGVIATAAAAIASMTTVRRLRKRKLSA